MAAAARRAMPLAAQGSAQGELRRCAANGAPPAAHLGCRVARQGQHPVCCEGAQRAERPHQLLQRLAARLRWRGRGEDGWTCPQGAAVAWWRRGTQATQSCGPRLAGACAAAPQIEQCRPGAPRGPGLARRAESRFQAGVHRGHTAGGARAPGGATQGTSPPPGEAPTWHTRSHEAAKRSSVASSAVAPSMRPWSASHAAFAPAPPPLAHSTQPPRARSASAAASSAGGSRLVTA